jgi:hypothetical protein
MWRGSKPMARERFCWFKEAGDQWRRHTWRGSKQRLAGIKYVLEMNA